MSDSQQLNKGKKKKQNKGQSSLVKSGSKSSNTVHSTGKGKPVSEFVFRQFLLFAQLVDKECGPMQFVTDSSGNLVRKRNKDIPFGWPDFFKGTQAPVFRMRVLRISVSPTAATAYTTVQGITAAALANFSSVASMWSEYRVLRGKLEYHPVYAQASTGSVAFAVGVVDYVDSAALGSFDAGNSYDTKKVFSLIDHSGLARKSDQPAAEWNLKFEKLPDEEWITTSTTSTNFVYWKPYMDSALSPGTILAGYLLGWVDIQVRGQSI